MNLNALLTKTVNMSGVVVIAIGRQAARVNVQHTVNTHPGSVLRRVLSRDVMLAAVTNVTNVSFNMLVLRLVRVNIGSNGSRCSRFRISFNVTVKAYLLLIALKLLTKLTPTCETVTVQPVRTVESRWDAVVLYLPRGGKQRSGVNWREVRDRSEGWWFGVWGGVGGCLGVALLMIMTTVFVKAFVFLCRGSGPGAAMCRAIAPRVTSLRGAAITANGMRPQSRMLVGPRVSNVVSRMCGRTKRAVGRNRMVTGMGIVPRLKRLGSTRDHMHITRVDATRTRASRRHVGGLCGSGLVDERSCRGDRMRVGGTHRRLRATGSTLRVVGRNVAGGDTSFDDALVHSAVSKLVLSMPVGMNGSMVVDGAFGSNAAVTAMTGVGSLVFGNGVSRARIKHVRRNVPIGLAVKTLRGLAFSTRLRCVSPGNMRRGKTGRFRVGTTIRTPSSMRVHSKCSTGTRVILRHTRGILTIPRNVVRFDNSDAFM